MRFEMNIWELVQNLYILALMKQTPIDFILYLCKEKP